MNPTDFLLSPFNSLNKIGDVLAKNFSRLLNSNRIFDLLLHLPSHSEKILLNPDLSSLRGDELILIKVKIITHQKPANSRQPYKIIARTPTGFLNLVFFKIYPSQIEKFAINRELLILGRLQKNLLEYNITHPEIIFNDKAEENLPQNNLVYPLVGGVTQKLIQNKIAEIFKVLYKNNSTPPLPKLFLALQDLHNPNTLLDQQNKARKIVVYYELLAWQLALNLVRRAEKSTKEIFVLNKNTQHELHPALAGIPTNMSTEHISKNIADEFLNALPFQPTKSQLQAALEIKDDLIGSKKMLRLLQGDVGSGKTILAIYACLIAIAQGRQACVIAPISLLAKQHYEYFQKYTKNINIEILTSKTTAKQKSKILQSLREGKIDILISTHAVLYDDVIFKNLGVAVIDEQHRFGVMQRLKLVEKSKNVDVLLMSATPIPRSLSMAIYADMDISVLNEKPLGRKQITTLVMSQKREEEIFNAAKRALEKNEKIYWICPLIAKDEELQEGAESQDLEIAEEKFSHLQKIFGEDAVLLLHGKMKESKKEEVMQKFLAAKNGQILVATTVIEVGIDVREATIIIIENAENFGLAQLHQLRGRVGRGEKQSYCILLYGKKYGTKAQERLAIMRKSDDGFFIANEDLKIRGSGELLGTRQSGDLNFKIANLATDLKTLQHASAKAKEVLQNSQNIDKPKIELLKLFGYSECLTIVGGG